uniref:Uncharacterized protein n=1 Tax=Glossina palpalis gambiensis TaxID=67801 RepID=A0A1B0APD0_9MUSC
MLTNRKSINTNPFEVYPKNIPQQTLQKFHTIIYTNICESVRKGLLLKRKDSKWSLIQTRQVMLHAAQAIMLATLHSKRSLLAIADNQSYKWVRETLFFS